MDEGFTFDGDKSPAQSADKSAHSVACGGVRPRRDFWWPCQPANSSSARIPILDPDATASSGEHAPPACGFRRRAENSGRQTLSHWKLRAEWVTTVRAQRPNLHARRMRSPFPFRSPGLDQARDQEQDVTLTARAMAPASDRADAGWPAQVRVFDLDLPPLRVRLPAHPVITVALGNEGVEKMNRVAGGDVRKDGHPVHQI